MNYVCPLATKSWFRLPQDTKVFVGAYRVGLRGVVIRSEETKEGTNRIEGIDRIVKERNRFKP